MLFNGQGEIKWSGVAGVREHVKNGVGDRDSLYSIEMGISEGVIYSDTI